MYCTAVVRPTGGFRALRCRGGRREKRSSLSSPPPYTWVSPAPRVRVKRHGGTLEAGVAAPAAELEGAEAVVVTWKGTCRGERAEGATCGGAWTLCPIASPLRHTSSRGMGVV